MHTRRDRHRLAATVRALGTIAALGVAGVAFAQDDDLRLPVSLDADSTETYATFDTLADSHEGPEDVAHWLMILAHVRSFLPTPIRRYLF